MLAKDELISLLQRCVEILEPSKSKKMKSALGHLTDLLAKFKQLDGKLSEWRENMEFFSGKSWINRTFCPETFVSVNSVVPCKTNTLKGFCNPVPDSYCWGPPQWGGDDHISREESSKENGSVPAAKGCFLFFFLFQDIIRIFIASLKRHTTSHYKLATPPRSVDAAGDERVSQSQEAESVRGAAKRDSRVYRRLGEVSRLSASICCSM